MNKENVKYIFRYVMNTASTVLSAYLVHLGMIWYIAPLVAVIASVLIALICIIVYAFSVELWLLIKN